MSSLALPFRARLTYCAHLFKAITRQHHKELVPLIEKHVPKDGVILDVGAHAGQFTKLFSRLVPEGHVYSFEPSDYARSILTKVTCIHGLKNVSLFPIGLSDTPSTEVLNTPIKASKSRGFGLSHIGASTDGRPTHKEEITLTTLDKFVEDNKIEKINFIKADIEGWEMRFLLGAQKTLERFKPVMFLEINDSFLQRAGNTSEEMWSFLKSIGYHIDKLETDGVTLTHIDKDPKEGDIWCVAS